MPTASVCTAVPQVRHSPRASCHEKVSAYSLCERVAVGGLYLAHLLVRDAPLVRAGTFPVIEPALNLVLLPRWWFVTLVAEPLAHKLRYSRCGINCGDVDFVAVNQVFEVKFEA